MSFSGGKGKLHVRAKKGLVYMINLDLRREIAKEKRDGCVYPTRMQISANPAVIDGDGYCITTFLWTQHIPHLL